MRQLTFVRRGVLEWHDVPAPRIQRPCEALVRPFIASRCDGDMIFLFNDVSRALAVGAKTGVTDRAVCALGSLPFRGPFPYGHECIAEVVEVGEGVTKVRVGQQVIVPWAVSCGECPTCKRGHTSKCESGTHRVSGYGFGDPTGGWGGMVSDVLRVPFADAMLFAVPDGIDPISIASASDNIPDAWRTVAPHLARYPGAPTLVMGGNAKSIGLYAAAIAVAMKSSHVDYLDTDPSRLAVAESLGANAVRITRRESWFRRGEPVRPGGYAITVDASNSMSALRYAARALAPGGVCTSVGFYFWDRTGLPLWQMYLNESTFHIGLSNPAADLPGVLDLVKTGTFHPERITSHVSAWDDAHHAFLVKGTKAVVHRAPLAAKD